MRRTDCRTPPGTGPNRFAALRMRSTGGLQANRRRFRHVPARSLSRVPRRSRFCPGHLRCLHPAASIGGSPGTVFAVALRWPANMRRVVCTRGIGMDGPVAGTIFPFPYSIFIHPILQKEKNQRITLRRETVTKIQSRVDVRPRRYRYKSVIDTIPPPTGGTEKRWVHRHCTPCYACRGSAEPGAGFTWRLRSRDGRISALRRHRSGTRRPMCVA